MRMSMRRPHSTDCRRSWTHAAGVLPGKPRRADYSDRERPRLIASATPALQVYSSVSGPDHDFSTFDATLGSAHRQ